MSRESAPHDVLPSGGENHAATVRWEVAVGEALTVCVLQKERFARSKAVSKVWADARKCRAEHSDHQGVRFEGKAKVFIAESVNSFNPFEFGSNDRVKILKVGLVADHAALAKEKESNVSEFSCDKERHSADFAAFRNDVPNLP